ncbi:MAG: transcription factor [Thermoproteota archaeon]|nr:transcription factor [Thermoproteota archaeon]
MSEFIDNEALLKVANVLGGEEAVRIVDILKDEGEVTDDEIAHILYRLYKSGVRLNVVRKILYRLYDHSLLSLRRTRDKETGWFIFHWKLQPEQFGGFISNQKLRVLEKLETRLLYEKNHDFYYCNTPGCKRIPFEDAMELVFRCPTCNKPLMHYDNSKFIKVLSEKIEQLRKELGE